MTNKEKVLALIAAGKSNTEIQKEINISLRSIQRYRKNFKNATTKKRKTTAEKREKATEKSDRKAKKEVAQALIMSGATIKEAAERVGLPIGTVNRWNCEEKMQLKQVEFLKEFRDQQKQRIINNKLKRLATNELALEAIRLEISRYQENGRISKSAMEKLLMNEQLEQLIFELDRIERLEKSDISDTTESKVVEYLKELKQGLGDDE